MTLLRWFLVSVLLSGSMIAQQAARLPTDSSLQALSDGFETLAERTTQAVVQVVTSGYGPVDGGNPFAATVARQRGGGSGVIVDPNGYIITNAHVVDGAGRVQVLLAARRNVEREPRSILKPRPQLRDAQVLGVDLETDLAVLRIDEVNLAHLELADSDMVRQGQLVFAFGSPLGLENSVTMGVVSAPARQLEPDAPMIYIQTDSAINPGNSGGPLLNVEGEVIGINTLIFSQSGGSEGVGFSVPSNIVSAVYKQLRGNGVVRRGEIGVTPQTITPLLAAGLGLSRDWGVILGDVRRQGPGDIAGLKEGDIILSLNGKPMENARQFRVNIYQRTIGDVVQLQLLRDDETLTIPVAVLDLPDGPARFSGMATRQQHLVAPLGILGIDLTEKLKETLPPLRKPSGVLVAALVADGPYWKALFEPGDVIYAVNQKPTRWLDELRETLATREPGDPVVVQVERRGGLLYLAFEME